MDNLNVVSMFPLGTPTLDSKMLKKVIYDVGSNNGDDLPYYLMKGDLVVAIEANPSLCECIRQRFADEIKSQKLVVECCVVTDREGSGDVDFYLHNSDHLLSQLPAPGGDVRDNFTKLKLPSKSILSIISDYGVPYYIKIDVEHYDASLLKAIFLANIYPPFVSAELHDLEVLSILVRHGNYSAFKLIDGPSVSQVYANRLIHISRNREYVPYSFPFHSAGPFGDDIDGDWMTFSDCLKLLSIVGLGWKDIHCTNLRKARQLPNAALECYIDYLISFRRLPLYIFNRAMRSVMAKYKILSVVGPLLKRFIGKSERGTVPKSL